MNARMVCATAVLLLWPGVARVSGSSTVTATSADFSISMSSVRFIPIDADNEADLHNSWRQTATHEINGMRARLSGLWPEVLSANPEIQTLPFDQTVDACGAEGPCRISLSPSLMVRLELVVADVPTDAQRSALTASVTQVLEREIPAEPATMVRDILGLSRSFPQLSGMDITHFDGTRLHFERGRTEVRNEALDAELVAYQAEVARREAEDADGTQRKRHVLSAPTKMRTAWEPNGVSLSVRFESFDPAAPPGVRAAAGFVMPGYHAIILQRFPGEDEAEVGSWRVYLSVRGDDVAALTTAIHDVLLMHGR